MGIIIFASVIVGFFISAMLLCEACWRYNHSENGSPKRLMNGKGYGRKGKVWPLETPLEGPGKK